MNASWKRAIAGSLFFAAALTVFVVIGMISTSEGASAWKALMGGREPPSATKLRLTALREWKDLRKPPPERIAAIDGTVVRMVGLCRPEPGFNGMWLVGERQSAVSATTPLNWSVWIPVPPELIDEIAARRGAVTRAAGVLRVGIADIGQGRNAAYVLESAGLWMQEPAIQSSDDGHEGAHQH